MPFPFLEYLAPLGWLVAATVYFGGHQYSLTSHHDLHPTLANPELTINAVQFSTRAYWMRRANAALADIMSPCPFAAFGTAIVNHTTPGPDGLGELVCIGANAMSKDGNPTLHGTVRTQCVAEEWCS